MNEPINYHFFLHIPKTAGTSIRELLDARFDPERSIPTIADMREKWGGVYPSIPQLLDLPEQTWRTAQLLRGHYYLQVADRFPRRPVCLTMLREPVARSISTVRHILRNAPRYDGRSLGDLVSDREFMLKNVANMQTKLLGVRFDLSDRAQWPRDANGKISLDQAHLEAARQALERFEFVGLQERFDESVRLLFDLFGWPMQAQLPRSNVGDDDFLQEVDNQCLQEVAQYNQLDQELYRFAGELFQRRIAALEAGS